MYNSHNIATVIKQQAKSKNVVIKTMLQDLDLGSNTMSAMYHGKTIASDSLARIADYLNCSVDYLLGREGQQAEKEKPALTKESELDETEEKIMNRVKKMSEEQKSTLLAFLQTTDIRNRGMPVSVPASGDEEFQ